MTFLFNLDHSIQILFGAITIHQLRLNPASEFRDLRDTTLLVLKIVGNNIDGAEIGLM